jgi:hypothetical protein
MHGTHRGDGHLRLALAALGESLTEGMPIAPHRARVGQRDTLQVGMLAHLLHDVDRTPGGAFEFQAQGQVTHQRVRIGQRPGGWPAKGRHQVTGIAAACPP